MNASADNTSQESVRTSKAAIASLILGILSFPTCAITAVPGIILGIVALVGISGSPKRLKGNGLAIAGIVVSCLAPFILLPGMLLPALSKAKVKSEGVRCMTNLKLTALSLQQYASEHNDTVPPADSWCDALLKSPVPPEAHNLTCPSGGKEHQSHYGLNSRLAGVTLGTVKQPGNTVLIFEIEGGWNVSGGPEALLPKTRHGRGVAVGFVDGHAEMVMQSRLAQLRWEP